jgi:hypothetical protein
MMKYFHKGILSISRLNYGLIVLLPKVTEVVYIKQFRLICLMNVIYKLFTKVLSIRLIEVAGDVISDTQTSFIQGRNNLERVLVLHEVVHELKVRKQCGILLKIDFEKTYDKVNLDFLKEVLVQKEFPRKWLEWATQAVEGGGEY